MEQAHCRPFRYNLTIPLKCFRTSKLVDAWKLFAFSFAVTVSFLSNLLKKRQGIKNSLLLW